MWTHTMTAALSVVLSTACAGASGPDSGGSVTDGSAADGGAADGGATDTGAVDSGADVGPDDSSKADIGVQADTSTDASADPDAGVDGGQGAELTWKQRFDLVFPTDHVVDLKLDFAGGEWLKLLTTWDTKKEKVYHPAGLTHDATSFDKVGVRLKGLSSLIWPGGPIQPYRKYPLKVDFNRFGGERYNGIDKLSLNNAIHDRTLMHERLAVRMYAAMNVKAPRTSYATLAVDGHNVGIYVLVQPIDKRFLKERYGTDDFADNGNLYKCVHNGKGVCNLAHRGSDKSQYLLTESCSQGYDECGLVLKTNEDDPQWNDYSDVAHLLEVLTYTAPAKLEQELAKVFDVDSFLRLLAVTFTISSYDSYLGKSNNFYLYHRPTDGRFEMLPWDFDGAYNGLYCNEVDNPTCGPAASYPLVSRILAVPKWRAQHRAYVAELLDKHFTVDQHKAWITEFDGQIGGLVGKDPNYPEDLAFYQQVTSLNPAPTFTENIIAFVQARRTKLLAELAK